MKILSHGELEGRAGKTGDQSWEKEDRRKVNCRQERNCICRPRPLIE